MILRGEISPNTARKMRAELDAVEVGAVAAANDNGKPTIDSLRNLPGFIYLGSPYSKYRLGHDAAAYEVSYAAALLMRSGLVIYAPITHGHTISKHAALPVSWDFWKAQCQPMIDAASALIVLKMNGWQDSVGLVYEIGEFERTGRPIVYVDPAELHVDSVTAEENMRAAA